MREVKTDGAVYMGMVTVEEFIRGRRFRIHIPFSNFSLIIRIYNGFTLEIVQEIWK
jgi:hypothetical protein